MTATIETSDFNTWHTRSRRRVRNIYSIVINGEDGNYQTFEVEASSESEAHRKADSLAQQCMVDVIYVEVYRIA